MPPITSPGRDTKLRFSFYSQFQSPTKNTAILIWKKILIWLIIYNSGMISHRENHKGWKPNYSGTHMNEIWMKRMERKVWIEWVTRNLQKRPSSFPFTMPRALTGILAHHSAILTVKSVHITVRESVRARERLRTRMRAQGSWNAHERSRKHTQKRERTTPPLRCILADA